MQGLLSLLGEDDDEFVMLKMPKSIILSFIHIFIHSCDENNGDDENDVFHSY